jgi:C4-dicarboxylate-specific signal transduction histidine kinase
MADFVFADAYQLEEGKTREFYETFLKGLVHKNNNLLGVIQGFSSLVLHDENLSKDVRESTEQMHEASKSGADLNKVVLQAGGCVTTTAESIDLSNLLVFWKGKCEDICNASNVALQFSAEEGLPTVRGNASRLSEILVCLISNAAEAASEFSNGTVALDLFLPGKASPGNNVDLFIRNTSKDLEESAIIKAYIPFESSKGNDHFGLGLTTAAIISGDLGIRLGLRSSEGTTTAWLSIPATD